MRTGVESWTTPSSGCLGEPFAMGCTAVQHLKRKSRRMEISPGSPSLSSLSATKDLLGCGQLPIQPHLDLPLLGQEEEPGWCGSPGSPVASHTCRIRTSFLAWAWKVISSWDVGYWGQVQTSGGKKPALCQRLDMLVLFCSAGVRQVRSVPGAQACNHPFGQQQQDLPVLAKKTYTSCMC